MTQRIEYTEEMVGNGAPVKADTLNRHINVYTTAGDTAYATAAATLARLAAGAANSLKGMDNAGTALAYKTIKALSTGEVYNASQPAFLITNTTTDANVTGDGTDFNIAFDGEITDQGSDATTTTFTAPVAGNYLLIAQVYFSGLEAADVLTVQIVTSNRNYVSTAYHVGANQCLNISVLADMDAADTAYLLVTVAGGDKDADIYGIAQHGYTFFSGALIC